MINKLIRYYENQGVKLVALKRHKYVCVNGYDKFGSFMAQDEIINAVKNLAKTNNLKETYVNNRGNTHIKEPTAVIVSYRGYTFIHPHLANIFFATAYPDIAIHLFQMYEQKSYLHNDNPRNVLYLPIEDGHRQWMKTFADELYEAFYRLYKIENTGKSYQHPLYFAQLTNKYIYDQLPVFGSEQVKKELKELRCTDDTRTFVVKLHQYLDDQGRDVLIATIYSIMAYINCACSLFDNVACRKQWLEDMLSDKKTGQTKLALNIYQQQSVGV